MKKIIYFFFAAALLASCKQESPNGIAEPDSKESMKSEYEAEAARKDSSINAFMQSMNEIEENLTTIKEKQKIVSINSKDVELQKTQPERIVEDISTINDLLDKNKKAIASLSARLKKANMKIEGLEKMIERLSKSIEEKDAEIASLKDELEKRNYALKNLFAEYNDRVKEIGDQGKVIATAYYAFGTMKELKEKGVVTKEGGFIGIGKNKKLANDFNKDYFTKIDIHEVLEIPLSAKKAQVITTHPKGSYKLTGEGKSINLVISNPDEFWSASKYLVVVIE